MFDWELSVGLHAMQGNRVSSLPEWEVSWFFLSCGGKLGYILELQQGWQIKIRGFSGRLNRAFRGPFHLKQKTQGPSHIHIPKGKLLLRCLWKEGLLLHSKTGNHLSSPDDMGCTGFSSCCFTELDVPPDLRCVSQRIFGFS